MVHRFLVLATLTLGVGLVAETPSSAEASLRGYVEQADETYGYEIVADQKLAGVRRYVVRLQSQTWRGLAWQHWLTIVVPDELVHADKATLMVGGGSSQSEAPTEAGPAVAAARAAGVPVAMLRQVPNQPLFGGMYEDAAIAHTFEQYLRAGGDAGNGDDWPLLLPMVKSVVRAMDTVERVLADEHGLTIDGYMLTGASKRGWTTWLTAAVDPRVAGIAPMVIDVLNFVPQMRQQQATYGGASPMIRDYTERGLIAVLGTKAGRSLLALVDPFAYREQLTLPKLIVLGTNDPYWTVDAANLYVDALKGPTHLAYVPNAGHQVSERAADTVRAFSDRVFAGRAMPTVRLRRESVEAAAVRLRVAWDEPAVQVTLWEAHSPNRDYRQAQWQSRELDAEGQQVVVKLAEPETGWLAAFVQVTFEEGGQRFTLSTPMTVVPEHFPGRR